MGDLLPIGHLQTSPMPTGPMRAGRGGWITNSTRWNHTTRCCKPPIPRGTRHAHRQGGPFGRHASRDQLPKRCPQLSPQARTGHHQHLESAQGVALDPELTARPPQPPESDLLDHRNPTSSTTWYPVVEEGALAPVSKPPSTGHWWR